MLISSRAKLLVMTGSSEAIEREAAVPIQRDKAARALCSSRLEKISFSLVIETSVSILKTSLDLAPPELTLAAKIFRSAFMSSITRW